VMALALWQGGNCNSMCDEITVAIIIIMFFYLRTSIIRLHIHNYSQIVLCRPEYNKLCVCVCMCVCALITI